MKIGKIPWNKRLGRYKIMTLGVKHQNIIGVKWIYGLKQVPRV